MLTGVDVISVANLVLAAVTMVCTLYLSYAALKHTAKPKIAVSMRAPSRLNCGEQALFEFDFVNVGYWYASPMAINVVAYCNFDPRFELLEVRYGSDQSIINTETRIGVGGMKYMKAKGINLDR
jgi:hypothetical protein